MYTSVLPSSMFSTFLDACCRLYWKTMDFQGVTDRKRQGNSMCNSNSIQMISIDNRCFLIYFLDSDKTCHFEGTSECKYQFHAPIQTYVYLRVYSGQSDGRFLLYSLNHLTAFRINHNNNNINQCLYVENRDNL